jgi:hypothetical protein
MKMSNTPRCSSEGVKGIIPKALDAIAGNGRAATAFFFAVVPIVCRWDCARPIKAAGVRIGLRDANPNGQNSSIPLPAFEEPS